MNCSLSQEAHEPNAPFKKQYSEKQQQKHGD
jgi:hypothetical protein